MGRFRQRHVALHLVYLGHEFYGYASQDKGGGDIKCPEPPPQSRKRSRGVISGGGAPALAAVEGDAPEPSSSSSSSSSSVAAGAHPSTLLTVETLVFGALAKACLVESRGTAGYTRCGRTDKGVSAAGQVLSLRLRSKALRRDPVPGSPASLAAQASSALGDAGVVLAPAVEAHAPAVAAATAVGLPCLPAEGQEVLLGEDRAEDDSSRGDDEEIYRTWRRFDGLANTGEPFPEPSAETDYALALNNILPPEIRCLGWADVPDDFSARFSATLRTYRYYFPARTLDLSAMRAAGQVLCRKADFRNICKIDLANTQNFVREILSLRIVPAEGASTMEAARGALGATSFSGVGSSSSSSSNGSSRSGGGGGGGDGILSPFSPLQREAAARADSASCSAALARDGGRAIVYLEIVGRAFLWHQIRCVAALLFMVGRGYETPEAVEKLLDVEAVPARPAYAMASEAPLVLHHSGFGEEEEEVRAALEKWGGGAPAEGASGCPAESEVSREDRPKRFLPSFPGAALGGSAFYASPAALKRVTMELEAEWSALSVKAAVVKGMLDKVSALGVGARGLGEALGLPAGRAQVETVGERPSTWGEALGRFGGRQGALLSLEDTEYPIMVKGGRNHTKGPAATPAERGYVPLLARAMGASVEDRWASLPEHERRAITAKHPHNAPRLNAAAAAAAAANPGEGIKGTHGGTLAGEGGGK